MSITRTFSILQNQSRSRRSWGRRHSLYGIIFKEEKATVYPEVDSCLLRNISCKPLPRAPAGRHLSGNGQLTAYAVGCSQYHVGQKDLSLSELFQVPHKLWKRNNFPTISGISGKRRMFLSKLAVKSRCKIRKTKSIIQIRKGKRGGKS